MSRHDLVGLRGRLTPNGLSSSFPGVRHPLKRTAGASFPERPSAVRCDPPLRPTGPFRPAGPRAMRAPLSRGSGAVAAASSSHARAWPRARRPLSARARQPGGRPHRRLRLLVQLLAAGPGDRVLRNGMGGGGRQADRRRLRHRDGQPPRRQVRRRGQLPRNLGIRRPRRQSRKPGLQGAGPLPGRSGGNGARTVQQPGSASPSTIRTAPTRETSTSSTARTPSGARDPASSSSTTRTATTWARSTAPNPTAACSKRSVGELLPYRSTAMASSGWPRGRCRSTRTMPKTNTSSAQSGRAAAARPLPRTARERGSSWVIRSTAPAASSSPPKSPAATPSPGEPTMRRIRGTSCSPTAEKSARSPRRGSS